MQNNHILNIALGLGLLLQLPAAAGNEAAAAAANNGDWCTWLKNKPGLLYKNKENPWIQEFQIEGRLQYQAAYIEGNDVNNDDFNETFDEYRRARLGTKVKFLKYFGAKYQVNLVNDARPEGDELDWGYQDIDEAYISFDLGKAADIEFFDELKLSYGRHKFLLGHEAHASSTKLLTPERSALSNKVYQSARPTGLVVEAAKGDWTYGAALFSSSTDGEDHEAFGSWQDGEIVWLNAGYEVNDQLSLGLDFVHNNADRTNGEDDVLGYDSAISINADYTNGRFGFIGDLIVGDNGDQSNADREGSFYGFVAMPYYWVMEDKLQAVVQFQHMASSEAEGVRSNSRYANRAHTIGAASLNSGRGDSHQSLYAGLNYYLCDHNAKVQGGIEYQQMDTPAGDFDTLTYILAFRTFF